MKKNPLLFTVLLPLLLLIPACGGKTGNADKKAEGDTAADNLQTDTSDGMTSGDMTAKAPKGKNEKAEKAAAARAKFISDLEENAELKDTEEFTHLGVALKHDRRYSTIGISSNGFLKMQIRSPHVWKTYVEMNMMHSKLPSNHNFFNQENWYAHMRSETIKNTPKATEIMVLNGRLAGRDTKYVTYKQIFENAPRWYEMIYFEAKGRLYGIGIQRLVAKQDAEYDYFIKVLNSMTFLDKVAK